MRGETRRSRVCLAVFIAGAIASMAPPAALADRVWGDPVELGSASWARGAAVAFTSDSSPIALWLHDPNGHAPSVAPMMVSFRRGASQHVQQLTERASVYEAPQLRVDQQGGAIAVWRTPDGQIQAARKRRDDVAFSTPVTASTNAWYEFDLATNASGDAVVAWIDGSQYEPRLMVSYSSSGGPFGEPRTVPAVPPNTWERPSVALGPNGEISVINTASDGVVTWWARPESWEWRAGILRSGAPTSCASIAADASGDLRAVWQEGRDACWDRGSTWSASWTPGADPRVAHLGSGTDGRPVLRQAANGGAAVAVPSAGVEVFAAAPGQELRHLRQLGAWGVVDLAVNSRGDVLASVEAQDGKASYRRRPDGRWEPGQWPPGGCFAYRQPKAVALDAAGRGALLTTVDGSKLELSLDLSASQQAACVAQGGYGPPPLPATFSPWAPQAMGVRAAGLRRRWRSGELTFKVNCSGKCTIFATGTMRGRGVSSKASTSAHRRSRGDVEMRLRFPVKKRVLKRLRRKRRAVTIAVRVRGRDAFGSRPPVTLRLKRTL